MYLEYWGLKKHPFNNVPDPEMYFDMHQTVDQAVSEILFAIEEGDEILAVAVGPVGSGKTMALRIVLDSLDHDKYRIAFVTNPDMTFPQLLRETIGQLNGKHCEERRKDRLFELFNRILFETNDEKKRVVIFVDEGNIIKPHNLDSLRLLTNMQDDHQNLFTIVLAGQPELAIRLEEPARANLFQRIGVYCKIEGIESTETMRDYIEHRLERAGLPPDKIIFTQKAYESIWEVSDNGMPRVINKICKLCLKAGETNKLNEIDERVVKGIANRFLRTYKVQKKASASATIRPGKKTKTEETKVMPAIGPKPAGNLAKTEKTSPPVADLPSEKPASIPPPQPTKKLSHEDMENLASKLATERVKNLTQVSDPFEAWEKARDDILSQMLKGQQ